MNVTNLMEDFAKAQIDDMYERLKKENTSLQVCDCENCRIDTLCYVLNRVPPKYTVSGRGVNHAQRELETLKQISADVDTVIMEGIRLINSSKRPNHNAAAYTKKAEKIKAKTPYFVFPIISGYVYDGTTFEPLEGAKITLLLNKKIAVMDDSTWQNPSKTFKAIEGSYSFCVKPEKTLRAGKTKDFNFELKIEAEGYDTVDYSFAIPISSKIPDGASAANFSLKVQDLFLFPSDLENPMERYPKALDEK